MHVQDYGNIAVFYQPVPFQDLLDSFHVERSVSFQALVCTCSSARAESNTSSRVLRYFARRSAFFFS